MLVKKQHGCLRNIEFQISNSLLPQYLIKSVKLTCFNNADSKAQSKIKRFRETRYYSCLKTGSMDNGIQEFSRDVIKTKESLSS